jgi:hypothetical protein
MFCSDSCCLHQAIVLCLDLSESMNKRSGVSRPTGHEDLEEDEFDEETAMSNLLEKLVKDVSEDVILENGETHLDKQGEKRSSDESAYSQKLLTETASQLSRSLEVLLPRRLGA